MKNPEEILTKSWAEKPRAGHVLDPGNTDAYDTGSWGTFKPVHDSEKCISCLLCWVMCPDSAILVEDGKIAGYDLMHCKGCGICAEICPKKVQAITMVKKEM
jgi:2-oxoacid:acceptor oxidoreductase delta subunit (pyruvate/2-ketoisovalerate family)